MLRVTLKDARRRLGELVDAAEHGETIQITRRGRVVAQLRPAQSKGKGAARLPDLSEFRKEISIKGKPLSATVVQLRAEGRF